MQLRHRVLLHPIVLVPLVRPVLYDKMVSLMVVPLSIPNCRPLERTASKGFTFSESSEWWFEREGKTCFICWGCSASTASIFRRASPSDFRR
jgi:hypothetical protein